MRLASLGFDGDPPLPQHVTLPLWSMLPRVYAVKVSGNWRIFFEFVEGDAYIVDYDDYH